MIIYKSYQNRWLQVDLNRNHQKIDNMTINRHTIIKEHTTRISRRKH